MLFPSLLTVDLRGRSPEKPQNFWSGDQNSPLSWSRVGRVLPLFFGIWGANPLNAIDILVGSLVRDTKPSDREPARLVALAIHAFPKAIGACKFKNYVFVAIQY